MCVFQCYWCLEYWCVDHRAYHTFNPLDCGEEDSKGEYDQQFFIDNPTGYGVCMKCAQLHDCVEKRTQPRGVLKDPFTDDASSDCCSCDCEN
jgi:hypothetical protein